MSGTADTFGSGSSVSQNDISIFGDTYDLTQIKNLLDREPSDSDDAQELLEELEDGRETVQNQYDELIREKTITELNIQYTYDCSVLSGRLAEYTYQQELSDWKETLEEAKGELSDLETEKAYLDTLEQSAVAADRDGTVAEIFYEAGDVINVMNPVVSYYNTDTVTVSIEVPQDEISEISVGDTVSVTVNGMMQREGTVAEKATDPVSGTSRTAVYYEVTVSMDNSDGMLSAGLSAQVRLSTKETAAAEADTDGTGEEKRNE